MILREPFVWGQGVWVVMLCYAVIGHRYHCYLVSTNLPWVSKNLSWVS